MMGDRAKECGDGNGDSEVTCSVVKRQVVRFLRSLSALACSRVVLVLRTGMLKRRRVSKTGSSREALRSGRC